MKHYVILFDYASESGEISFGTEIAGIAHSPEDAKAKFAKVSADEKQYAKENGWVINVDSDEEFAAGERDNYDREHAHFYIKEVDEAVDSIVANEVVGKIDRIEEATLNYYRGNITRERYVKDVDSIRKIVSEYVFRNEPSDTDFALIRKLADEFTPSTMGRLAADEKKLVFDTLELGGRNTRELRNLRDMFMMFSNTSTKNIYYINSVTSVIDEAIFTREKEN